MIAATVLSRGAMALGFTWITTACAGENGMEPAAAVAAVEVTAPDSLVVAPQSMQLTARVTDVAGKPVQTEVAWISSDTAKAAVSGSGMVTGRSEGRVTITAAASGKTGSVSLRVIVPVASLSISPDSAIIRVDSTRQLSAEVRDARGNVLVDKPVTWSSTDTTRARVSSNGLVTGLAAGSLLIVAASEQHADTARVTVVVPVASVTVSPDTATVAVGDTRQLAATVKDAEGNLLVGKTVAWTSTDTARATVSGSGVVRGVSAGTALIVASSEGRADTASVRVRAPGVTVSGVLSGDTRWTRAGGPYLVTGNILIPAGSRLRVDPGTQVLFEGAHYIKVEGTLAAIGTPSDSIVFTSASPSPKAGDWSRIWFTSGSVDAQTDQAGAYQSGSGIGYAVISYGGAIHFDASSPYFAHNRIHHVTGSPPRDWPNGAIWACNSASVIRDNVIEDNPLTGIAVLGGAVQIRRNVIRRNTGSWGGAIFFANANCADGVAGQSLVEDNRMLANRATYGGAIALYSGSPIIRHNDIKDNVTTGALGGQGNGAALVVFSGGSSEITFNNIENNSSSATGNSAAFLIGGSFAGKIQNNNISNPTTYEIYLRTSSVVSAASNFWNVPVSELPAKMWDFTDNVELGRVTVEPVLTARVQTAGPR